MTKADRYEPDLNVSYAEMAAHYGVAIIPARPYRPRDKLQGRVSCTDALRGWEGGPGTA